MIALNEWLLLKAQIANLSDRNWVCPAAKLPVGLRPKGGRSRGKLPILEADILNRGSDTRNSLENSCGVCSVKTDRF